jgi:ATP-dependent protease ClpP protease subunit
MIAQLKELISPDKVTAINGSGNSVGLNRMCAGTAFKAIINTSGTLIHNLSSYRLFFNE